MSVADFSEPSQNADSVDTSFAVCGPQKNSNISQTSESSNSQKIDFGWLVIGLILPLAAMLPLTYLLAKELWTNLAFRFFPIAIVVGFVLWRTCNFGRPSVAREWIAKGVLLLGLLISIWGTYLMSTHRIHLAWIAILFSWSLGAFGGTAWTRVAAISSLFAATMIPPWELGEMLSHFLESISAWLCSGFLDAISIPNLVENRILQVEGLQVSTFKACGDAGSVFAVLAFGLAMVVIRRRSFLIAVLVSISAILCFVLGNFVRLLAISIAQNNYLVDLTQGNSQWILGLLVFCLTSTLLIFLEELLAAFFAPIGSNVKIGFLGMMIESCLSWPFRKNSVENTNPPTPIAKVGSVALIMVCAVSLAMGGLSAWVVLKLDRSAAVGLNLLPLSNVLPGRDGLPDALGSLKKTAYSVDLPKSESTKGQCSHLWQFGDQETQAVITLKFPFNDWYSMSPIFEMSGWKVIDTKQYRIEQPAAWTVEELKMKNRFGITGYAWYGFFDESGQPISYSIASNQVQQATIFTMLKPSAPSENAFNRTFLVQLFFETGKELSDGEAKERRALFIEIFERIRQQSLSALVMIDP